MAREKDTYIRFPHDRLYERYEISEEKLKNFVIVYFIQIGTEEHQVTRYDMSHGFAHKDIFYQDPSRKEGLPALDNKELVRLALQDIKENWKDYRQMYIRILKEKEK